MMRSVLIMALSECMRCSIERLASVARLGESTASRGVAEGVDEALLLLEPPAACAATSAGVAGSGLVRSPRAEPGCCGAGGSGF